MSNEEMNQKPAENAKRPIHERLVMWLLGDRDAFDTHILFIATAAYDWHGTSVVGASQTLKGAALLIQQWRAEGNEADNYLIEEHCIDKLSYVTTLNGKIINENQVFDDGAVDR